MRKNAISRPKERPEKQILGATDRIKIENRVWF